MRRGSWCRAILAACWVLMVVPESALAAGWPFPEPARVLVAYGSTYQHAEGTSVHRGVDLAAAPGTAALAAFAGQVTFAGRVPAGPGATCGAVTLQLPDGLRITYMPLDELAVSAGEGVGAGQPLGLVAASGDASSAEPHLHVSVRRSDLYIDPMTLLVVPVAPVVEPPAPEPVQAPAGAEAPVTAPGSAVPVAVQAPASAPANAGAAGQAATVPNGQESHGAVTAQGVVVASPAGQGAPQGASATAGRAVSGAAATSGSSITGAREGAAAMVVAGGAQAVGAGTAESRRPEVLETRATPSREAARAMSRQTATARRRLGPLVPAVALAALLGLWPLWRMRMQVLCGDVVPVGDDVAAVVGR